MRLIDADALKKAIIKRLGIKSEKYLLASERSIYNLIDEQKTVEQPKEQQPRVLTIREIPQFINKPVYFETWNFQTWAIITAHYGDSITLIFRESETRRCFDSYEKYFRLWDKEPTEEQRKAVQWKDGEQE